ncbi:unnamed protein product [Nezara viridula]|uniref:Uncharacterized protein n=1 Tax=Nezara viridula TaxID=85310 RepID=A0A9P0H488_NEZVI|nr:unnamed protein product [Nezara viridula]
MTASEFTAVIDLLRALTEEVKQMKSKLQGIDELKEINGTLQKQSELSFENIDQLLKMKTLLEEQKTHVEKLILENNTFKN